MPAGIDQSDWDGMTLEERKRELKARGYVEGLVIQTEIGEAWGRRFYERLISRLESTGVRVPEVALKRLPLDVFEAISKNSTSVTAREFDPTERVTCPQELVQLIC
ncbi:MAG: hypothetical protein OXG26_16610 [Caldilineaceae bacterium]|nr:hypothetical protein [Caldilineaceae bacterium]